MVLVYIDWVYSILWPNDSFCKIRASPNVQESLSHDCLLLPANQCGFSGSFACRIRARSQAKGRAIGVVRSGDRDLFTTKRERGEGRGAGRRRGGTLFTLA